MWDGKSFLQKTLTEGRWINYLWASRPVIFSHHVVFFVFHTLWALFAAAIASAIIPNERYPWLKIICAISIGLCPPILNISFWPASLIPGMALTGAYAACVVFGPFACRFWALPIFVALTLMCHGSLTLLLAVIALIAPGWTKGRSGLVQQIGFASVFAASFVFGTLLIFALNWSAHGVFGVQVAAWRNPTPAEDLAGVIVMIYASLAEFAAVLQLMFRASIFAVAAAVGTSLAILGMVDRDACVRIVFAVLILFGFQAAQAVVTGVITPFRGYFPLWIAIAAIPALGLRASRWRGIRIAFLVVVACLIGLGLEHWRKFTVFHAPIQQVTRDVADKINKLDASVDVKVYVFGHPHGLFGGVAVRRPIGLARRLTMLTGREVIVCVRRKPEFCSEYRSHSEESYYPEEGFLRIWHDGAILVNLPNEP